MKNILIALRTFIFFAILCGIIYPFGITLISKLLMPQKAGGSLLTKNGAIIGSRLIGQSFTGAQYFHSRYSAVDYNASASDSSNLGPSSEKLLAQTKERIEKIKQEDNVKNIDDIPADMLFASGSGLDPHISQKNALLQLPRIARIRNIPEAKIKNLITKYTAGDFIGIWGHPGINVLELNSALDNLSNAKVANNGKKH